MSFDSYASRLRPLAATMLAAGLLIAGNASAQNFPERPLRIIVPFAAGGPTDIVSRVVGQKVSEYTGQPVIVDNRPGAGGNIGTELAAKSPPDGYTLLLCSSGPMVVTPALGEKMPYDPVKDLSAVSLLVTIPYLLLVNSASGPSSVKELIALAHKNRGKLNYGSAGQATTSYFAALLFSRMANIDMSHIPYKGSSQAGTDLAGGQLNVLFEAVPAALTLVKTNKVKTLGVSSLHRLQFLPEIPTIAENGVPGYEVGTWSGLCTAGGTPHAVVEKLSGFFQRSLKEPEIRQRFAGLGAEVVGNGPKEYSAFIRQEQDKWAKLVKAGTGK
mgnify:CR=1 FL=1